MVIHNYEKSKRGEECEKLLRELFPLSFFDTVIILPIPTTRDGRHITGTDEPISSVLSLAEGKSLALGYGIPKDVEKELKIGGATVIDSSLDEEFLRKNAELTAEGTVGMLLTETEKAPRDLKIGVAGYGRIGKSLVRLLLFLGAEVRVFTSSASTRLELSSEGISAVPSGSCRDLEGLDILINTAPAVTFDKECDKLAIAGLRVIDLASGDNFPKGTSVDKYPSVPARLYPVTAGRLWAESVKRLFEGRKTNDE